MNFFKKLNYMNIKFTVLSIGYKWSRYRYGPYDRQDNGGNRGVQRRSAHQERHQTFECYKHSGGLNFGQERLLASRAILTTALFLLLALEK